MAKKKMFESARITPNDDNTYQVSISPPRKKDKKGNWNWPDEISYSAQSMKEAVSKIESYGNDNPDAEEDVNEFMTGSKRTAAKPENE